MYSLYASVFLVREKLRMSRSQAISIRLEPSLVRELKQIARRWSYRRRVDLSWVAVLETAARALIREEQNAAAAEKAGPATTV